MLGYINLTLWLPNPCHLFITYGKTGLASLMTKTFITTGHYHIIYIGLVLMISHQQRSVYDIHIVCIVINYDIFK